MTKRLLQLAPAALLILFPSAAMAQAAIQNIQSIQSVQPVSPRLAAFSPGRAFAESAEGKAGLARLDALRAQKAREIDERNKVLQSRQDALERSAAVLSGDAFTQQTKDVERFRLDVQRFIEDAQAEFLGVQRDIETAFLSRLKPVVERVARAKSLQVVFNLDEATIAWLEPTLDITPEIVQQLAAAQ